MIMLPTISGNLVSTFVGSYSAFFILSGFELWGLCHIRALLVDPCVILTFTAQFKAYHFYLPLMCSAF
jgi:hypothetical protein